MKKLLLILSIFIVACSPKPSPIGYGVDECRFCRMTIVDQQHAAELVSTKAKVFKFDAIECMVQYITKKRKPDFALFLVNDFSCEGSLGNATGCTYLISENIPSPMGAFLSAFTRKAEAEKWMQEKSGVLYTWHELLQHLKHKNEESL